MIMLPLEIWLNSEKAVIEAQIPFHFSLCAQFLLPFFPCSSLRHQTARASTRLPSQQSVRQATVPVLQMQYWVTRRVTCSQTGLWQSQEWWPTSLTFTALPTGDLRGEQKPLLAAGNSPWRFSSLPFPTACSSSFPSPGFICLLSLSFGSPFVWAASSGWMCILAPCETLSHILLFEARLEILSPPHDCYGAFCGTPRLEMLP